MEFIAVGFFQVRSTRPQPLSRGNAHCEERESGERENGTQTCIPFYACFRFDHDRHVHAGGDNHHRKETVCAPRLAHPAERSARRRCVSVHGREHALAHYQHHRCLRRRREAQRCSSSSVLGGEHDGNVDMFPSCTSSHTHTHLETNILYIYTVHIVCVWREGDFDSLLTILSLFLRKYTTKTTTQTLLKYCTRIEQPH